MQSKESKTHKLALEIRASAASGKPVDTHLATSQRIIARVTDGIYREPWAAFRELIANSYDADSSNVMVETGAPDFEKVVVRDDGIGMSPETLAYVLRNIGGSSKRTEAGVELHTAKKSNLEISPGGRPLIGKIGIGLFAVAQLTQHFQIITKARGDRYRSSATVKLQTHDETMTKEVGDDEEYIAGQVKILSEKVPIGEEDAQGTSVILYSLRPEIRRTLQSVRRWNAARTNGLDGELVVAPPMYHLELLPNLLGKGAPGVPENLPWGISDNSQEKFEKFVEAAGDVSSRTLKPANLEHFDEYLRMLWKLSLSLPLDYVGEHPFDINGSSGMIFYDVPEGKGQSKQFRLKSTETLRQRFDLRSGANRRRQGFEVLVDGLSLKRPISLSPELRKSSRVKAPIMMVSAEKAPFKADELERAGGKLEFEAYLYWNSKIVPKDTAGALVRIREASGTLFDASFMNYQVSEQNRLSQITAEIFVTKGLDSAINIDRESFNYSHPHYLYIQGWLRKALRLLINRQKALASQDLQKEKAEKAQVKVAVTERKALSVWERRYGEESDPPVSKDHLRAELLTEVGGVGIEWDSDVAPSIEMETAAAVAIVLEAYGALSSLTPRERAKLITDILDIFE